jgi:hypothetical protein
LPERRASNLVEEPLEHFDSFVIEQGESEIFGPDLAFVLGSNSVRFYEPPGIYY